MLLDDLTVEVRASSRALVGQIRPEELILEAELAFNNVGWWKLELPADHPMSQVLSQPSSGIVVSGPNDIMFSGMMTSPKSEVTPETPGGIITFEGVTDEIHLADTLCWPDPSNGNANTQDKAHDVRTGPAETLMHEYVEANIGPSGSTFRKVFNLTMGTDMARGPVVTRRARFRNLGELLHGLAAVGNLGFRVIDVGNDQDIRFETYEVEDLSSEIRLDIENGQLSAQRFAIGPPTATHAIVGGQGQGKDRHIIAFDTDESKDAWLAWGRRVEVWVDARQSNELGELQQAADEILQQGGFTLVEMEAVPSEDAAGMEFGRDWYLGDKIAVVIDGAEHSSIVTGAVIKADPDGLRVGVKIGPPGKDRANDVESRVHSTEARIQALEQNTSAFVIPPGISWEYHGSAFTVPVGWLLENGAEYDIADYQDLYDVIGDEHNTTGDGVTTFNVPDSQSRFRVGAGTYAALGHTEGDPETARDTLHEHTISSGGGHTHTAGSLVTGSANDRAAGGLTRATTGISGSTGTDGAHDHGGDTGLTGGAGNFPHIAVNFIIKT